MLIELLPHHFVVPDFLEMSSRLGVRHYPLISALAAAGANAYADRLGDLTVEIPALRQLLATVGVQAHAAASAEHYTT